MQLPEKKEVINAKLAAEIAAKLGVGNKNDLLGAAWLAAHDPVKIARIQRVRATRGTEYDPADPADVAAVVRAESRRERGGQGAAVMGEASIFGIDPLALLLAKNEVESGGWAAGSESVEVTATVAHCTRRRVQQVMSRRRDRELEGGQMVLLGVEGAAAVYAGGVA